MVNEEISGNLKNDKRKKAINEEKNIMETKKEFHSKIQIIEKYINVVSININLLDK